MFILLVSAIIITILRDPSLFINPRFWAEEGRVYFKYAVEHPAIETLTATHMGYFSLIPTIATWLATYIPYEYAPFVTLAISFAIQLIPCLIVIYFPCSLWPNAANKTVALLLILLVNNSPNIWLNVINSQFHLLLAMTILLISDIHSRIQKAFAIKVTLLAATTGPISCFLTPLFLWKYCRNRSTAGTIISAILLLGCFLHAATTITQGADSAFNARLEKISANGFTAGIISYNIASIATGVYASVTAHSNVQSIIKPDQWWLTILLVCAIAGAVYSIGKHIEDNEIRNQLIGSFLLITILLTLFSIRGESAPRYGYTPSVILSIILWQAARKIPNITGIFLRRLMLAWVIFIHGTYFVSFYHTQPNNWPVWQQEIITWYKNPHHKITVHPPFPAWQFHLYPERSKNINKHYSDEF